MPTTFANTIDGNDIFAKRAECDAAGNDLSTTYATKNEIPDGVPTVTSSDNNKVLKASYSGGVASYSWQNESGGGGGGSYTAGTGIDITNDVISVDTSVVATQTDLADKEDAFTVGTGLEMDTTGGVNTLQVETPMDIVAGPGIAIDNPDSDTLRVSVGTTFTQAQLDYLKAVLGLDETVLYSGASVNATLSELPTNFERIRIEFGTPVANTGENIGRGCIEISMDLVDTSNNGSIYLFTVFNGDGATHTPYYTSGYVIGVRTLTWQTSWTVWGNVFSTSKQTSGGWFQLYKIVGIHRIANN